MQYIITFLEGIVTFISPCLLPMLPVYLGYFAGGGERGSKKTLRCALGFVLGFTALFVLLVILLVRAVTLPGAAEGETATFYGHVTGSIGSILDVFKGAVPDWGALAAIVVGAVVTFVLLTRAVDWMMNNHYSVMFHGIIGLVIAATIFTIPFGAFTAGVGSCLIHIVFVVLGCVATLLLDKFNQKVEKPGVEE